MTRRQRERKIIAGVAFRKNIEKRRAEKRRRQEAKVREVREFWNSITAGPLGALAGEKGLLLDGAIRS